MWRRIVSSSNNKETDGTASSIFAPSTGTSYMPFALTLSFLPIYQLGVFSAVIPRLPGSH